jgi:hypothetical protein
MDRIISVAIAVLLVLGNGFGVVIFLHWVQKKFLA